MKKRCLLLIVPILIMGCNTTTMNKKAIDSVNMNLQVDPGTDFYEYANGGWMQNNPLTEEYSRYGTFDKLQEDNNEQIKSIINKLAENGGDSETYKLVSQFYTQGMDSAAIEQQGLASIQEFLDEIDSIASKEAYVAYLTQIHQKGISPYFLSYSTADKKNSDWVIIGIWQGSLGMNDRDYYLLADERTVKIQEEYRKYVATLFELIGEQNSEKLAKDIFNFEYVLAEKSMSRLEMRDPKLTYNKMNLAELNNLCSVINWNDYFEALAITSKDEITVGQIDYMKFLPGFIESQELSILKNYLKFYVASSLAPYLSNNFVEAQFAFYGKVMQGKEKMKPRWKRVVSYTNAAVGEALGQAYVKEYFPPSAKERMETLVDNLIISFENRIQQLDWMSDTTKVEAVEKLKKINVKIGYPNKWRDYSNLKLDNEYFVHNVLEAKENNKRYQMAKIGKPVDPDEWLMLPHTVNAYYHPIHNEIVFPAGILQPPFFFKDDDDAVNYGAIGVVIGHEITHGFDDKGRQYDKHGMLNDWWTAKDDEKFNAKAEVLVDQFNEFEVLNDVKADGKLTLGENIADLGGLKISYAAFSNTEQYKNQQNIDGFSPSQRFFLAYAQVWAQNIRDEEMLRRVKEDVHSLGEHRVNGPLPNLEEFYAAFDINENDSMYIPVEDRAEIW
jgi:putative endopeptidase